MWSIRGPKKSCSIFSRTKDSDIPVKGNNIVYLHTAHSNFQQTLKDKLAGRIMTKTTTKQATYNPSKAMRERVNCALKTYDAKQIISQAGSVKHNALSDPAIKGKEKIRFNQFEGKKGKTGCSGTLKSSIIKNEQRTILKECHNKETLSPKIRKGSKIGLAKVKSQSPYVTIPSTLENFNRQEVRIFTTSNENKITDIPKESEEKNDCGTKIKKKNDPGSSGIMAMITNYWKPKDE